MKMLYFLKKIKNLVKIEVLEEMQKLMGIKKEENLLLINLYIKY